jgi:hypothetical protein
LNTPSTKETEVGDVQHLSIIKFSLLFTQDIFLFNILLIIEKNQNPRIEYSADT